MCYAGPVVRQVTVQSAICRACYLFDVGAPLMVFPSIVYPSFRGISHLNVEGLRDLYLTLVDVSWTLEGAINP